MRRLRYKVALNNLSSLSPHYLLCVSTSKHCWNASFFICLPNPVSCSFSEEEFISLFITNFSSCKILAHLLNELLEWCAQERSQESKLSSIEHLLCIRNFFFFLYFLDFILLLFKKGIVTHNLHRKNQHSECEWF